jgi:hypothetical protein
MFQDLPQKLQQEVKEYLAKGNFPKAKEIHDNWKNSPAESYA